MAKLFFLILFQHEYDGFRFLRLSFKTFFFFIARQQLVTWVEKLHVQHTRMKSSDISKQVEHKCCTTLLHTEWKQNFKEGLAIFTHIYYTSGSVILSFNVLKGKI